MVETKHSKGKPEVDAEGFLANPEDWDESVAHALAKREGITRLTEDMMEVIRFMRTYYKKFNAFPILNYVCKNIQQPKDCVSEEFINPEKAWKIAGLPKPSGVHFVSVDKKHYIMEGCC
ncbi:MAG: TusE/DsrC/DsvC family sulfur relay protein [Desulfobacteraceae bacterium]|nr:TusE/DsrC/DsvC family sulfur relay protein [Desulfobacteraceae bacterium]